MFTTKNHWQFLGLLTMITGLLFPPPAQAAYHFANFQGKPPIHQLDEGGAKITFFASSGDSGNGVNWPVVA